MDMRFAFDIGTNSIGSAVWRIGPDPAGVYGDNAPLELLWAGVRTFTNGRQPASPGKAALANNCVSTPAKLPFKTKA